MPTLSLRAKLTLVIGGLIAVTLAGAGAATRSVLHNALARASEQRSLDIGAELARRLTPQIITHDPYDLSRSFEAAIKDSHLKYVVLLDQNGMVVMHSDLGEVGKTYDDAQSRRAVAAGAALSGNYFRTEESELVDDVVVPVDLAGVRLGTLRLGFSHADVEQATAAVGLELMATGALATGLALLCAFLAAGILVKPINELTEATNKVTQGDLSAFVATHRGDELGSLARAFNTMTEELRATTVSRDHLDNIFNSAGDALLVIDADCNVITANKSLAGFLGVDPGGPNRAKCFGLLRGELCQTDHCVLARTLRGEANVAVETTVELPDGRRRFVRLVATPLIEKTGLAGIVESIQDITDQKTAEEEKEHLRAQLLQAQKMESIGRLAGGVAHDFNNILSVILGYTELMANELPEGDPQAEKLQAMGAAAEKAATLTRQLLAFSRKQVLALQVVNMNTVIENVSGLLKRLLGEDISLEFFPAGELDNVMADPNQIEQVLMNLAVNARDAMPDGGHLVIESANTELDEEYLRTHAEAKIGPYVRVSVTDTGVGISHELQERVFDPFFSTKEPGKGTGLGLSTAYGIVKQHGGHLLIYSEPGVGTTFKLYLPATDEVETRHAVQPPVVSRAGSETVLVVDDEVAIRQLVKDSLQPLGYRVIEAANGEEALGLIAPASEPVHVLITDVIMPGMNGWALSKAFAERSPGTRTIFMSGYTQNVIVSQGVLKPDLIFINKPLTPGKLAGALWKALDSGPGGDGVIV